MIYLFAVAALRSDSALIARHAVEAALVRDEGLGPDGLPTAVTRKAVLVPRGAAVLQHPRACQSAAGRVRVRRRCLQWHPETGSSPQARLLYCNPGADRRPDLV